jgi:hypothetical protein
VKITAEGVVCGGVAILPALSKSIVIDLLVKNGRKHLLNGFLSGNARAALGLGEARTKVRYRRDPWPIPKLFEGDGAGGPLQIRAFMGEQTCIWKRVQ